MKLSPTIPDSVRQNFLRNAFAYWSYRLNSENRANFRTFPLNFKRNIFTEQQRNNSLTSIYISCIISAIHK